MRKSSQKRLLPSQTGKEAHLPTDASFAGARSEEGGEQSGPAGILSIRRRGFFTNLLLHILIIIVLGCLLYSNTLRSPFQWDEAYFLTGNPAVKNLSYFASSSPVQGMSTYSFKNRYIGYLSFALNYRVHGFTVTGYHVVNLVIHLINALLVYALVVLTFRTPYMSGGASAVRGQASRLAGGTPRSFALAVALLFVAHPVQTEAVTYVFQRFASLVSLFYLLSLVLYIQGRILQSAVPAGNAKRQNLLGGVCFVLSFIAAVLAMKTKENAFTLPVVMTLYEFLFFRGKLKTRLLRLLPFLLTMLIIPVSVLQIEGSFHEIVKPIDEPTAVDQGNLSGGVYVLTQFRVITTYIRLLLLPTNQNVVYNYPAYHSLSDVPVLLSFLFLTLLFAAAVYLLVKTRQHRTGSETSAMQCAALAMEEVKEDISPTASYFLYNVYVRLVGFGILWFFITLSIESSIIPLALVIDEYRVYLPSVGFFLAAISMMAFFTQKIPATGRKIAVAAFVVLIFMLGSATFTRNAVWSSKLSLWEDVLAKSGGLTKVYNNLGIAYYEQGLYEKAIGMYTKAIGTSPDNFFAYSNLGVAYAATGHVDQAIETLARARDIDPKNGVVYANLARAYRQRGELGRAEENYRMAVALNPYNETAYYGLGTVYVKLGRPDEALAAFERSCALGSKEACEYLQRGRFR